MKYKIIFKGDMEPMVIDEKQADAMKAALAAGRVGMVDINGLYFHIGSIKAIAPLEDPTSQAKDRGLKIIKHTNDAWEAWKQRRFEMTPKDRAQNTKLAELVWRAIYDRKPTEAELFIIRDKQEKFFLANPDYAQANPVCYIEKFEVARKQAISRTKLGDAKQIKNLLPASVLTFAARNVMESRKYHS